MFQLPIQNNGSNRLAQSTAPDDANNIAQQSMQTATQAAKMGVEKASKIIAKHPGVSLAAAVTCGVVIGWLIKRTS